MCVDPYQRHLFRGSPNCVRCGAPCTSCVYHSFTTKKGVPSPNCVRCGAAREACATRHRYVEAGQQSSSCLRCGAPRPICSMSDCIRFVWAGGLCNRHMGRKLHAEGRLHPTPSTPAMNAEHTLRHGGTLHPPLSLPYRVLARTCPGCGDFITTPDHLIRRGTKLPTCGRCGVRRSTAYIQRRRVVDDDFRRTLRRHSAENRTRTQAATLAAASRWGFQWSGPELELVARGDLSARQVAAHTGRTLYAVKHMRSAVLHDPRYARLADVAGPVADRADP